MTRRRAYETEEKLRTYQFVIESAHDAIFFKDLESRYIIVNNKTLEAFGLPREDVIGKNDYELMLYKKEAEKNVNDDQIVFKSAKPKEVTKHMTGADGEEHWFQAIKVPQFDENGNVIGLVGIARDITKQKRIEQAVEESEEKYRNLIERANDGVIIVQDGVVKFVNNRMADLFGYSVEEVQDTPFLNYVFPDERKRIKDLHERRLKGEDVPDIYEMQALHNDGRKLDVETNSGIITYHGKPAVLAFVRDITERKQIEETLRESESRYKSLFNNNHSVMLVIDPKDGDIVDANPAALSYYGWSHEELTAKKITDINMLTREQVLQEIEKAKSEQRRRFIFRHRLANGDIRDVEVHSGPIQLHGQQFLYSIIHDITDRKRTEEALESERDKLKALLDGLAETGIGVDIVSAEYKILQQNQTLADQFGNIVGKKCYQEYMALEEPCSFCPMIKALGNKRLEKVELQGADGRDYEILSAPLTDPDGTTNRAIEVIIDITDRKRAEEAIRKSEQRFRNLTEITSDWIWEIDKNACYTYVSPKIYDMLGYDPEEIIGKTPFDLMRPDESDRVSKIFNNIASLYQLFSCIENINIHKDGHPVVFETSGVPIFDSDGKFCGYRGIDRDITERKQIEEELRKSHDELEHRVKERTKELEIKTKNLEELNTALEVLLKKREGDKKELEGNVLANVKGMIEPYFKKIKKTKLDDEQKVLLSIIESNLREIISPFASKLSSKYINLTPAEMQIADFVKHGKRNKEIADILNLSIKTIESHRESIRKKIGIKNTKTNLRSYLLSFQ